MLSKYCQELIVECMVRDQNSFIKSNQMFYLSSRFQFPLQFKISNSHVFNYILQKPYRYQLIANYRLIMIQISIKNCINAIVITMLNTYII